METSPSREENSKKKMILSIATIVFSIFSLSLNGIPRTDESIEIRDEVPELGMSVDHEDVVRVMVAIMGHDTKSAFRYVRVAQVYADHFQYEAGLPWAEKALQLDPDLPEAHLIYGYLHFKLVHTEEAIAAFERTIDLEPKTFEAYLYLGIIHRGAGDPDLGIIYFTQALEVAASNEDASTAYVERGLAYGNLDRYEESMSDFEIAQSLNPDNGWVIYYRGIVSEKMAAQEATAIGHSGNPGSGAGIGLGS
jgi:tetratricopeptide (TPR) repeat protein